MKMKPERINGDWAWRPDAADKILSDDDFYKSDKWRRLRYKVIQKYEGRCMACKCRDKPLHVDHIKPRSLHPELELSFNNLQVLCEDCNIGKSNIDETDWREPWAAVDDLDLPW